MALNVNHDNIIDVPGSTKTNAVMTFALPSFGFVFNKKITEYEQAVSNVQFSVVADSAVTLRESDPTYRPVGQAFEVCKLLLSLPKHHPKSLLLPAVSGASHTFLHAGCVLTG